ncbi:MAG: LUD domain-containing protein [Verrucomicrobiaceae bacterium]|nr:LUD domain-containing protein [Verrucomicrobiaceae bacterium]
MKDDRVVVMASVRASLAKRRGDKAALPDWDPALVVARPAKAFGSLVEQFRYKFEAAGGVFVDGWAELEGFLAEKGLICGYVDPVLIEYVRAWPSGTTTTFDRGEIDCYEFSVTRATAGIAESGTILLTEEKSSSRLGALSSWVHVAVLNECDLLGTIPEAIEKIGSDKATVFVTGPSKTADVEGILIKGVHGPGIQVCCLVQ